jgi:ribonuclease T2
MPARFFGRSIPISFIFAALTVATALALFFCSTASARQQQTGFDYYALALSWSPTYCVSNAGQNDRQQCAPGRQFAFVVHGLWPQYRKGWPEFCDTRERWVTKDNIDEMLAVMPSRRLIIHEWKKHGSCSGLSQDAYFDLTQELFAKVRIPARYLSPQADVITTPAQIVADFVKTNKNLLSDMISVQCGDRRGRARLTELRICFDIEGEFASCGVNELRQCRADILLMPPVR